MGIKFVTGTAGSGRTYYARQRAAELARQGQRTALLVPEQFSFESERAMLRLLNAEEADRVEVFSFTKLAGKISREVGQIAGRRLDECGRAAVMNVAVAQVQDHLSLYAGVKKGQDFIANMLTAINEFKSCAISPELLAETADQTGEAVLSQKLRELSMIYGAYNACIANLGSIDPLDDLTRLAKNLEQIDFFEGMTVIADSFTGFTRQEYAVLEKIIGQCDSFEIMLCCEHSADEADGDGNANDLFASVYDTARALSEFDDDITWESLKGGRRFRSEALRCAEAGIFRPGGKPFGEPTDGITVYAAADKYDEAEFTAREIRRLVREQQMRWRDFAIICRTASDYQSQILRALALQGIPVFCDKRAAITELPLVRFVLSAMDVVNGRWRSDDILRWLKTGMLRDISPVEAARLENYCFIWSISGSKWKREFTQSPRGYTDQADERDEEVLQGINASRDYLVGLLTAFEEAVKAEHATGRDMAAAVYHLIESAGAAECIEVMLPKLPREDADAQGQVWNAMMNILDQLADILGDTRLSFREFVELFTLMVGLCDVGRIPQSMDEVVFGAADRIRTSDIKAVFVVGANDGVFPLTPVQTGVFTDNERRLLIDMKLPLSGDAEDGALSEQLLAYAAMTCASDKLYVTYSKASSGEAQYPSDIVTEITRVVPQCSRLSRGEGVCLDMIEGVGAGFLLAAKCMEEDTEFARSLTACYEKREEYAHQIETVRGAYRHAGDLSDQTAVHDRELACALFGRNIRVSASKAECFYQCPFEFFCQYGMKAQPRRRAELNPLEYGSVVHYVLENLLRQYDIGELVADSGLKDKINQSLTQYLNDVMGGADMKSARFMYLFRRLSETLAVLVVQLGEEFAKSLFRPNSFEVPIDEGDDVQPLKIPLSDGTHITVGGKIDRVDIFDHQGTRYVRVVDYKTGSKEFVLSDLLSGLNMQMMIYLDILCDRELSPEPLSPAGAVYSPASLKKASGIRGETSFEQERQEMLKKNGLIVDDGDVINAMEIGMEKKVDKTNSAKVKGAQTFRSAATYVADTEQLRQIRGYVRFLLRRMGESLHNGEIAPLPVKGEYDACAYCDYRVMCSSQQKESGRTIKKKSMAETLELMKESVDEQ